MRSRWYVAAVLGIFLATLGRVAGSAQETQALTMDDLRKSIDDHYTPYEFSQDDLARVIRGFRLAPVPLNLHGKNLVLVGLGSYIVNGQGGCNDCHTAPPYTEGNDPFLGEKERINVTRYLAGGTPFGPPGDPNTPVSRNLTPRASSGLPAGLTWEEFRQTLRTGADLKHRAPFVPSEEKDLLQVMPWPVYGKMVERDLRAVYEFLRAIPTLPSTP
jgi:hypothetical protein